MTALTSTISALGGIASTRELRERGFSLEILYGAVRRGEILRPRKGWYAHPSVAGDSIRAWRVGGRLACLSAAAQLGLWVPTFEKLHVEVAITASRLRAPNDRRVRLSDLDETATQVHWTSSVSAGGRTSVSVEAAVRQVFDCQGDDSGFIALESALNLGKLDEVDRHTLIESLPQRSRSLARHASHHSDSGGESELKLMLLRLGIPFRQQVLCAERWPVDFLLGEHLAIEADSRAHHSDPYRDRKKDAELSAASVRVLRFMYSQIHFEQSAVERAILSALARGDAHFA
jgi:very-short-patch-repair endonuclease